MKTNYCDCEAFRYKVLRGEQVMCKHTLAARIAAATAQLAATAVDDASVPALICGTVGTAAPPS